MLIPEWQRVALGTETLCHLIPRLGFIQRLTLSCTLFAAANEQQGNKYQYDRHLHFQFPQRYLLTYRIVAVALGLIVRTKPREIISCHCPATAY